MYSAYLAQCLLYTQRSMNASYYDSHHCYLPTLLRRLREIKNERGRDVRCYHYESWLCISRGLVIEKERNKAKHELHA